MTHLLKYFANQIYKDTLKVPRQRPALSMIAILLLSIPLVAVLYIPHTAAIGATGDSFPTGITLFTDEAVYTTSETVNVKGEIHPPINANNLLLIKVLTPSQEEYKFDKFQVNRDGFFSWSFLIGKSEPGTWTIDARYGDKESEVTFKVLDQDIFDKVIMDNPVMTDGQGREITPLVGSIGQNIAITANLVNDEDDSEQPFVFIVQIINVQDGTVSQVSWASGSLPPSQSAGPSVTWLPTKDGTYTAEIFVWSSLDDPTPLVEKQTITFKIES